MALMPFVMKGNVAVSAITINYSELWWGEVWNCWFSFFSYIP